MTFYRHPSFFPGVTSVLFLASIFLGVVSASGGGRGEWTPVTAKALLALGFLVVGTWFMYAFTQCDPENIDQDSEAEQRASMFRFAYMFSLFSFALLVLPFTAMVRTHETPPDAGPIRLLRACVVPSAAARPASGVVGPVEFCPNPTAANGTVTYPWLVSVGGVVAQECGAHGYKCWAEQPSQAASPPSQLPPMFSVSGGFVVPFYVVVFAFIGGIVNLTRRLPEYQKRSACNYVGTPEEPKLMTIEAREFVVFQLMQLLSSPFVAMVAYYAIEPKSIANTVALAFISGFATESVLLLIRGVVNGVQPRPTKTVAAATATASLHVTVQHADGVVKQAKVELLRRPTSETALRTAVTDASGQVEFQGLAAGTVWVVARSEGQAPHLVASHRVDLKAGQTESIALSLTPA